MKIKYLYLILENCEQICVAAEDIEEFGISVQQQHLQMNDDSEISTAFSENDTKLVLKKSANKHYHWFDDGITFDRILAYPDITGIEIEFENGTSKYCLTNWEGDKSDCNNTLQRTEVLKDGRLMIYIGKMSDEEWRETIEYANL